MRSFALTFVWYALVIIGLLAGPPWRAHGQTKHPNVVLIITDDQGYGDLGTHGNPKIHTTHLDRLAGESVQFARFYVSPVCSPTRASLLTGRYNYRTGVVDTYLGRSLMHPDETTLAELLAAAGYSTGLFGKWHLGDNYPLRAMDQGFQESLVLNGGGIGQPSDPPGGASYFDPLLRRQQTLSAGRRAVIFRNVQLPAGQARLECWWEAAGAKRGVLDATVRRRVSSAGGQR